MKDKSQQQAALQNQGLMLPPPQLLQQNNTWTCIISLTVSQKPVSLIKVNVGTQNLPLPNII